MKHIYKIELRFYQLKWREKMKTEKLSLRIKPNVKKSLLEIAEKEQRTLSNYVNLILENHIKNNKESCNMNKIELVRNEILGQEMDFCELDNSMMKLGFLSEADSGVWSNCLQDGNIVYSEPTDELGNTEPTVQIFFEVVAEAGDGEVVEASIVKITSVENF